MIPMKRPSKWAAAWTASRLAGRRMLGLSPGAADNRIAEQLTDQLDRMKGMAMKVGQVMSYLDVPLPDAVRDKLARLQTGSDAMPAQVVESVLEQALGSGSAELFDSFDPEPVAAASIGQVHRARFEDRDVAVKIQYPDVASSFDSDMSALHRIGALASALTSVDGRAIVREAAARLHEECDYTREAKMQTAFRAAFSDEPSISIPEVIDRRTSRTVLTTEWVDGDTFADVRDDTDEARRTAVARDLVTFSYRSVFEHLAVQADPHPGNFIFSQFGPTTILDFGCVGVLDPELVQQLRVLIGTLRSGDRDGFRQATFDIGMVGQPKRFDFDHHFYMMAYLFRPLMQPGFRFEPGYTKGGNGAQRPRQSERAVFSHAAPVHLDPPRHVRTVGGSRQAEARNRLQ